MRMVVDLPAPFAPRKPKISPSLTVSDTRSTAVKAPKRLVSSRISTAAVIVPTARSRPAAARRSTASASVRARAALSWASSASRSSEEGMTPSR